MIDTFPKVSVLMSVYNGECYLTKAIESILEQTFTDFEFIIINDGSTDNTRNILAEYAKRDQRIILISNEKNIGLTQSLNKGLQVTQGKYIARMDADDVSLPERLEKQVKFLEENPGIAAIFSKVCLIDKDDNVIGDWPEDTLTSNYAEIKGMLPKCNCLAHPTLLCHADLLKKYRYRSNLVHSQDYDLWLRFCSDELIIEKIDDRLLNNRIHRASVTYLSQSKFGTFKDINTKLNYIWYKVKRLQLNLFDLQVCQYTSQDIMRFFGGKVKRVVKNILIRIGLIMGQFLPLMNQSSLFFFFRVYHIGGAERVHADIVNCFPEIRPWVIFDDRSQNSAFKPLFETKARVFDISSILKSPIGFNLLIGIVAAIINKDESPVVFGGVSRFFYPLLPWLKPKVRKIDLLHNTEWITDFTLLYVPLLENRIVITKKIVIDLKKQYSRFGLDSTLLDRVQIIENKINIPNAYLKRNPDRLNVIYVGRGTEEKRVYLVGRVASKCGEMKLPVKFTLIGDVQGAIEAADQKYCDFKGEISDFSQLEQIYQQAHLLLLTSIREGFPLVIMEAMAYGVVPISTNVGGISEHLISNHNGYLINEAKEEAIVDSMVRIVDELSKNKELSNRLSYNAYEYARSHFSSEKFYYKYRELLLRDRVSGKQFGKSLS